VAAAALMACALPSMLTPWFRGRVSVRDFVTKTVIVRAGKRYVARATQT
jgi:hypothetical protein